MKCVQIEKEITKIKLKNKTKKKQMEISAGLKVESPYTSYCLIVSFFFNKNTSSSLELKSIFIRSITQQSH